MKHLFRDPTFTKRITNDLIEINCEAAFDFLNRQINDVSESIYSLREENVCPSCNYTQNERFVRFVPLDVNVIDLKNLQVSIQPLRPTRQKCKCGTTLTRQRKANKIIGFDVDEPIPDLSPRDVMHLTLPSNSINEITQKINFDGKELHLYAVLCYTYARKHFYSKVKRQNGNWELYDDLERAAKKVKTDEKDFIQALFYLSGKLNFHIFVRKLMI